MSSRDAAAYLALALFPVLGLGVVVTQTHPSLAWWALDALALGGMLVGVGAIACEQRRLARLVGWQVTWAAYGRAAGACAAWSAVVSLVFFPLTPPDAGHQIMILLLILPLYFLFGVWAIDRYALGRCYSCAAPQADWQRQWERLAVVTQFCAASDVAASLTDRRADRLTRLRWRGSLGAYPLAERAP